MTENNKQDTTFPSGGSRTEYIGAKVTAEQKRHIRRLVAECGMTVSSYVLARAFNYRPKARLTARQETVMETLIGMPQRPRELHVRAPWHEPREAQTDV